MSAESSVRPRRRWRWQPNPIIVKELRSRMRGGRAFVLLTGFLLGLGLVGYGLFLRSTSGERFGMPLFSAQIGQTLFVGLAFAVLFLVCLIAPAVTVGAISSERERLTYEMLMTTSLPPYRLLWGKLISALTYIGLLLLAAIPLGSIVYLFGGITLKVVLQVLTIIIATAITAGMIGLWASAMTGKTARAAVISYLLIGTVLGGLLFTAEVWTRRSDQEVPLKMLTPNPISALASAVANLSVPNTSFGGPIMMDRMQPFPGGYGSNFTTGLNVPGWSALSVGIYPPSDPNAFGPDGMPLRTEPRSTWRTTLVLEALTCIVLFWMTLHAVRPRRRWMPGWGDLAMLSITLLSLAGMGWWRGWWLR